MQVGLTQSSEPFKSRAISLVSSRKGSQKGSKHEMNLLQRCYIEDGGGHVTRNVGSLQKQRTALAASQQGSGDFSRLKEPSYNHNSRNELGRGSRALDENTVSSHPDISLSREPVTPSLASDLQTVS